MILLSVVLERLDSMKRDLDEIKKKMGIGEKEEKKGPANLPFAGYIRDHAYAAQLLDYLHKRIEPRYRVDAIVFIQAAIDAGALSQPPFAAAEAEFPGHMGSDSLYNDYVGNDGAFSTKRRVQQLADAVEEIRKIMAG